MGGGVFQFIFQKASYKSLYYNGCWIILFLNSEIDHATSTHMSTAASVLPGMNACSGFGCGRQQKRHTAAPPPAGVWRRMERNRQKLVGRDKGSLTEQQTEGTGKTMIQIRRKHNTNPTTQRAALHDRHRQLPSCEWVPSALLPLTGTQHDGTWYGIPGSVWPGWGWVSPPGRDPSWILVKINPVLAKPRTMP